MRRNRRGMTLLELAVAGVLLAALTAVCAKFFAAAAAQRRALAERQTALQVAGNLMERLAVRPYEQLSTEKLSQEKLPLWAVAALPKAALKIEVTDAAGPPAGKRIALRLTWSGHDPAAPFCVQLTSWRYPKSPNPNPKSL
jgi:Tfp pilus assembly protein PilE